MKAVFAAALALVAAAVAPAVAHAAPGCGDVVTEDVVLTESLTGCATGLTVGADDVTIDLGGHSIEGTGAGGTGVTSSGHSGVTITNGAVRGFNTGVRLSEAADGSVSGLDIQAAGSGLALRGDSIADSAGLEITGNRVRDSSTGFSCFVDRRGPAILLSRNVFSSNGTGVTLFNCSTDLIRNDMSANAGVGVLRFESAGLMERNTVNHNGGDGIRSSDSHGSFLRNVTNDNGGDGLAIRDSIADHGPFYAVERHVANGNGRYGIFTTLAGVEGAFNRAHANGEPAQCLGVVCNE